HCFLLVTHPPPPATYTLSLHDALPISDTPSAISATGRATSRKRASCPKNAPILTVGSTIWVGSTCTVSSLVTSTAPIPGGPCARSEEHTSELQSRENLVCRLLLEKKKR